MRRHGHRIGPDGISNETRERYIREHLDRVIKGENTFEVAQELQYRYKQEQRKLKRDPNEIPKYIRQAKNSSYNTSAQNSPNAVPASPLQR